MNEIRNDSATVQSTRLGQSIFLRSLEHRISSCTDSIVLVTAHRVEK